MSARRRHALRRHATTLVLVALTVGAGLWVMLAERHLPSTAEQEARRHNLLPTWNDDALTRVDVVSLRGAFALVRAEGGGAAETGGDRTFEVVRGDERFAADPGEVDRLLTTLQLASIRRAVAEGSVDRAAMGLEAPAARVTLAMGAVTHHLAVGGAAPGDGRYVELEGRGVFVVPAAVADAVAVESDALRDRTLVPVTGRGIARLSLEGEGGTRRLERAPWPDAGSGGFRFADGGPRVASRPLDAALDALGRLRAEVFLPGDAGPLEEPRLTVTVTPETGETTIVVFGGPCPDRDELLLVHRTAPSPLRACVARDVLPPLLRPRAELEDTHLVGATLDAVVEVRVARGAAVLEMARKGAGFAVRRPEPRDVPEAAARSFLDAVLAAKGELETGAPSLDGEGAVELRIVSRPAAPGDPERVETVHIGPADGGRRWARRAEDGATLVLDDAVIRPLLAPELVLRDRKVIDVAAEKVREVAVDGAALDQRIRRAGAGVELVDPKGRGLSADETWSLELLDRVAKLEAVRWVALTADPAFGLDPPRFTLEATIEGEAPGTERKRTVRFGAPGDDGPFAQIDGDPAVFVAPADLEEAALRWLVDRGAFRVRPADVVRVVVRGASGPPLTLERVEGALVPRGDAPDAAARAARVREGIDDLVALEAVAIGAGRAEHGLASPVVTLEVTPREGKPYRVEVGATDAREGESVHYARRSDVDAVFTVGRGPVRSLLEAVR